jgi:hypothetical protein
VHVAESFLRWPTSTRSKTRRPVRIGAYCQIISKVRAVSISMLLLDGEVSDFQQAVAQYRADLRHHSNRKAPGWDPSITGEWRAAPSPTSEHRPDAGCEVAGTFAF